MIKDFEIKNFNGEETLFLYLDLDYEFAFFEKNKQKNKRIKNIVKDFFKNNEINFAGTTIAIVAGGMIIGNLFLNKSDDLNLKNSIISINVNTTNIIDEVINEDFASKTTVNSNVLDTIKNDNKDSVNDKSSTNKVSNNVIEDNEIKEETDEKNASSFISKEEENKTMVTVFRNNGDILNLELEEYLINVVAAEMPASFNMDALRAQAVLARTYAIKSISQGKVLTDTTSTQVYKSDDELKKLWGSSFDTYFNKIKDAVFSTSSEILKYDGDYIEAVYHSTSNGYTENSLNVWGNDFPYLKTVTSLWDINVKNFSVSTFFTYDNLSKKLGFQVDNTTEFIVISRNESNRVNKVKVGDYYFSGIDLRNKLSLRSTDFDFVKEDNGINITTKGYGHGVGMSQYGANEMAKSGYTYKEILSHYYSGTSLEKL